MNNENIINNDPRDIVPDHCNMSDQLIILLYWMDYGYYKYNPLLAFL